MSKGVAALRRDLLTKRVVRRFLKRNSSMKRRKSLLRAECSDSDICMILGSKYQPELRSFFRGFADFHFLQSVKQIGKPSDNGFIHQLTYAHRDYSAFAVLKSSAKKSSDNLMYEHLVGQFLNTKMRLFPNFVETYSMYQYADDASWDYLKATKTPPLDQFKRLLNKTDDASVAEACQHSKLIAILIQNLPMPAAIPDLALDDLCSNLFAVFYQVYFALSLLRFTHYDLHENNVLLYEPAKGKYIQYTYHNPDGSTTTFKSKYLAKIIDYGRSYFYESDANNSKTVYQDLCRERACNEYIDPEEEDKRSKKEKCGDKSGFYWFKFNKNDESNFYIMTTVQNPSIDLRFWVECCKIAQQKLGESASRVGVEMLPWISQKVKYDTEFGTKAMQKCASGQICNVVEAREYARRTLDATNAMTEAYFAGLTKLGDLHVFADGREFEFFVPN